MTFSGLRIIYACTAVLSLGVVSHAATFGTAVPVRGTVSDIALDESRGRLYIANFAAGRIEVMNTADSKFAFGTALLVSHPPSSIALSPGNHYLVAGEYNNYESASTKGGLAIFNLDSGARNEVTLTNPVLSVAFGSGSTALVVTTGEFLLLDPATAQMQTLGVITLASAILPVPLASCTANVTSGAANIVEASTGVSGDQQTILILAQITPPAANACPGDQKLAALLRYQVGSNHVDAVSWTATPPLGPRAVSVNKDGTRFVAGWVLADSDGVDRADFPNLITDTPMDFRKGGHAFDYSRGLIYADLPVYTDGTKVLESPVMHVVDADNLTVRKRIQLPQMMAGRSLFSSDMTRVYAVSDGGVMVLPVASLDKTAQVAASQEDVVFQSDICTRSVISQSIDIVDPSGGNTDFALSLPSGTSGIQLSQTSGTTPATVRIDVDPTAFQSNSGTTTIALSLQSSHAINIPSPVRLLINTRELSQHGRILNVPGKLVDILPDTARKRLYVLRQDKNLVLVYDTTTWKQVAAPLLRTGNTPMSMAMTPNQAYLLVGNDHSQLINVFDLETLQPWTSVPFIRTDSAYPRSVAVGQVNGMPVVWAAVRDAAAPDAGPRMLFRADFPAAAAAAPADLGIWANNYQGSSSSLDFVLTSSPSKSSVMFATPDGIAALWDGTADEWVVSRQDVKTLSGAYGALTDNFFITDNRLLDQSLFAQAQLETSTGLSSGVGLGASDGLRTTTKLDSGGTTASGPGTIERIGLNSDDTSHYLQAYNGTSLIEASHTAATLQTTQVGQVGQTISAFTRTLAAPTDESYIALLSQSGLTIVPPDFDTATSVPVVTSVTNAANGSQTVTAAGQVLISGTSLAPGTASASAEPLPTMLGDTCVTVGSAALPLFWVSPTQIKAVLPSGASGSESLTVHNPGGVSSAFTFGVQTVAPVILTVDSGSQAGLARVIRQKNGEVVNFTNPIHPKETISIYMTGLGTTLPAVAAGEVTPASPPSLLVTQPTVTLGGTALNVTFAGLSPGEVGVYRVDAYVPWSIRGAAQTLLTVTQDTASASAPVRVVNP